MDLFSRLLCSPCSKTNWEPLLPVFAKIDATNPARRTATRNGGAHFRDRSLHDDLIAAEGFYREVMGLEVISRSDLLVSFRCAGSVLLIFNRTLSAEPNRDVPSHGTTGAGHVAFALRPEEFDPWMRRLEQAGVVIEQVVEWEQGGRSIYFRDAAGNSLELAPPTLWGGGWEF